MPVESRSLPLRSLVTSGIEDKGRKVFIDIRDNGYARLVWLKKFIPERRALEQEFSQKAQTAVEEGKLIEAVSWARRALEIPDYSDHFRGRYHLDEEVYDALDRKRTLGISSDSYQQEQQVEKEAFHVQDETTKSMTRVIVDSHIGVQRKDTIAEFYGDLWGNAIAHHEFGKFYAEKNQNDDAEAAFVDSDISFRRAESELDDGEIRSEIISREIKEQRRKVLQDLADVYKTGEVTYQAMENLIYLLVEGSQVGMPLDVLIFVNEKIGDVSKPFSKERRWSNRLTVAFVELGQENSRKQEKKIGTTIAKYLIKLRELIINGRPEYYS